MKKIVIVLLIGSLFGAIYFYDLTQYLNLEYVKSNLDVFKNYYNQNPWTCALGFSGIYILATALSIPGATILTLTSGAIFGLVKGVLIVSFSSTIGATLAFLASRYLLRDSIQSRYGEKLKTINKGVENDGASYLFSLRLLPVFPFFLINLLMGLTPIKVSLFYLISQLGMLPGTFVYVNAGSQLANIDSLSGILSPGVIFSFVLLGLFPLIVKNMIKIIKDKRG